MEDPIALSWAKSVHRTHNGTRRVSIISNDKETTWGEGEKERGLSKTSRGVRRSLLLSILSGKRREGGTSVEVDKFFYSRKAEKVTVPSLEGKKEEEEKERGEERPTKPVHDHDGNSTRSQCRTCEIFYLFLLGYRLIVFLDAEFMYVSRRDDFRVD